ncbi:uncharacterized protein EDB91DRAFT_1257135 [Suillus paluster]|uniref:uncharacterized protein n=1 Tax=Suillus paluster TaxID=48578 RepID=UPI001B86DB0E|nr:uncharacterized protein EDB91DRAFT_1257135 [Suillus paluster]KAG1720167.1 hypothetical protein EDB91DRAFT_1257135 [Suillus paluster]
MYWNTTTSDHVPFRHGQSLSGTPVFASINNHLGVEPGCRDNLELLTYMLIYFLRGSLPWLTSDNEKLSNSTILECKAHATIADICHDIPVEFANILIYTRSLAFAEDPDYDHLHSVLHGLCATLPAPATCMLDFSQPDGPAIPLSPDGPSIPPPLSPDQCCVAEAMSPFPAIIPAAIPTAIPAAAAAANTTTLQNPRQRQLPVRYRTTDAANAGPDEGEVFDLDNISGDEEEPGKSSCTHRCGTCTALIKAHSRPSPAPFGLTLWLPGNLKQPKGLT